MIKKLFSNLGIRAIRVLGVKTTLRMWWGLAMNWRAIVKEGNLFALDQYMSKTKEIAVKGRFGLFKVRPQYIDQIIIEPSATFSAIRELYVRDCYLRYHSFAPEEIETVVDLGANRGLASAMFTPVAKKIVCIESNTAFSEVIRYTVATTNSYSNLEVGLYYVGERPVGIDSSVSKLTMIELFSRYKLKQIDFLKIDIEGAEFKLFEDMPLSFVKYLSMEVHRTEGSPKILLDTLQEQGFEVVMANSQLLKVMNPGQADYFYARNLNFQPTQV